MIYTASFGCHGFSMVQVGRCSERVLFRKFLKSVYVFLLRAPLLSYLSISLGSFFFFLLFVFFFVVFGSEQCCALTGLAVAWSDRSRYSLLYSTSYRQRSGAGLINTVQGHVWQVVVIAVTLDLPWRQAVVVCVHCQDTTQMQKSVSFFFCFFNFFSCYILLKSQTDFSGSQRL